MKINLTDGFPFLRKTMLLTIMRLFILLFCTSVFSFSSADVMSQNTIIRFDSDKELTIDQIFDEIIDQTDYTFLYQIGIFDGLPKVKVKKGAVNANDLLSSSLPHGIFNFSVEDENVIVIEKLAQDSGPTSSQQQTTVIKGTVTDEDGMPLAGVTVLVNTDERGTVTDINGQYSIKISLGDKISFSYVGFATQEFIYNNQVDLNITLIEDTAELDEVVILSTGYQNISPERATGSFASLNSKDIEEQRPSSLSVILEGRIVGYQNGLLRGTTSMNGLTSPLYVIDGFPIEKTRYNENFNLEENLPNLNLEDIESITVLKDAAAASIYGARASNGVIVITTKKAKVGQTNVSFSTTLTYSPYKYYTGNLTDAGDIIGLEQEWAAGNPNLQATDGSAATYAASLLDNAVFTSQGMQAILNYYVGNLSEANLNSRLTELGSMGHQYYDDIEKYAKRDQYFLQHNISFGKATEKNNFTASITYKGNKYDDIYSKDESVGINMKNTTEITNWLSVDLGTYIYYNSQDFQTFDAFNPGFMYQPYNRLVNADGTPFTSTGESRYSNSTLQAIRDYDLYSMDITPMNEIGRNINKGKNFSNRTFAKFNVTLSKFLTYNAMFQYEYGVDRISQLRDQESFDVRNMVNGLVTISPSNMAIFNLPYGDILKESNQFSNAYNFRQQLNFNKLFKDVHEVSAILGNEIRHSKLEYNDHTRYGWNEQTLSFAPINQVDLLQVYGSVFSGYLDATNLSAERELINRYVSFYGNAGYTYDGKYTLIGSLRWDRSNLWGTDNKYQNKPTWSAGASWNIDKETFFQPSWVDRLKLRFSYGIGGNIAKNSAPYLTASYNPNNNIGGLQGSINSRPNPELSWEKTTTTNVGLDFSVLKHRLSGTIDYYNKKGEDLLANSNGIPTEGWGYSTYTINNGEMTNEGIEVSLNGTLIKTPSFKWDASILYAHNKNKVTYVDVEAPVYFLQLDYPSEFPRVGNDYNSIYGYRWAGLSSSGLPQVNDASGDPVSYEPGDLEAIEDYGTTVPTQSGSFHTSVSYKNFSISALFIYQLGHNIRNSFLPMLNNSYSGATNSYITNIGVVNNRINDRWQQSGDESITDIPRVVYEYDPEFSYDLQSIYSYADVNIIDASNVKLSNVSLSYQIPPNLATKLNMQNIRLNFNVENVFTIAKSKDAKYLLGGYQTPNFVFGLNVNF